MGVTVGDAVSTRYGTTFEFHCFNDCQQTGCPGHKVRAVFYNTSDTLAFEIDGKTWFHVDHNAFQAMMQSYRTGDAR